MLTKGIPWLAAAVLLFGTAALAQPTAADKCAANKNQTAAKYGLCRQKAEKKLLLTGDGAAYGAALVSCDQKYATKWQAAETRWIGSCPTSGDANAVQGFVTQHSVTLASALSGTGLPRCGDGTINVVGEQCDDSDVGGATCTSLGYPGGTLGCANCLFDASACDGPCLAGSQPPPLRTGQTTCYDTGGNATACAGSGQDGEIQYGSTRSFTDNGDGTFTDNTTGLMWEQLGDDGGIHDWNGLYAWANAIAVKIAALNAGNFAGYSDWRLPNVNELQTLANYGATYPAVYSVANSACVPGCTMTTCSCTQSDAYWTSTTSLRTQSYAWYVSFVSGFTEAGDKSLNAYVRAVR